MKKHFSTTIVAIFALGMSSVYGQFVNPVTPNNNVTLTNTSNNVVLGPVPSAPTNLHVNSNTVVGSSSATVLTIENSGYAMSRGAYLKFINGGQTFTIGTNSFPAPGSDLFHIANIIHTNGSQVTFSTGYSYASSGVFSTSKYNFIGGRSAFDSIYSSRIGVNMMPVTGYNLGVWGNSYFQNKVVIGTTNTALPTGTHKLYVGGSIICEELVVKLQANWPDYVFTPSYKLMPLSQVKTYIAENNHLPGVPAACEVEENGVATGEILTIQMKKIEELTLYLIQMKEENEALLKRIEALEVKQQ